MWMSAFKYVIHSTKTVQTIMQVNDKSYDYKLKQETEGFIAERLKNGMVKAPTPADSL